MIKIRITKDTETLRYAAEELKKYVKIMTGEELDVSLSEGDIVLGLLSDLSLSEEGVDDPMIDDVIDVNIDGLRGYIGGSNERSVLMGVYNYLKSAGCRWVRPGDGGEYIPKADLASHSFVFRKKADLAFRGECIEGAVSFEHVRDTILWLPKVNMNLFMMEQVVPYNYMSRWYNHEASTVKESEGLTFEDVSEFIPVLEKTIKKCGLQLHALGHGYLLEPYGIHYKTYDDEYTMTKEALEDVALVNGKRELFQGSPNFTQLCMSKDRARLGLVNFLVGYLEKKPHIDFLHVWLSDSVNNHCECEECQKKTPTDFYVQMLNELDERLTAKGIDTKIVFIMYTDTLWAPETEVIKNKDRFIMTTATSRNYSETLSGKRSEGGIPPYVRNNFKIKLGFDLTLSFMDGWQKAFDGRRFLFEYYMYTDHFFDPGYMQITKNILKDIRAVESIGFEGIMSDQTQRSFFPTGLPMSVIGEGQFDKDLDPEAFTEDYFKAAYGEDYKAAMDYLSKITELFDPDVTRVKDSVVHQDTGSGSSGRCVKGIKNNPETGRKMALVEGVADGFAPTVEKNLAAVTDKCHKESWKLLKYHVEYVKRLSAIYSALTVCDIDRAKALKDEMIDYLSRIEDEIHPQFDLVLFNQRIKQIIKR